LAEVLLANIIRHLVATEGILHKRLNSESHGSSNQVEKTRLLVGVVSEFLTIYKAAKDAVFYCYYDVLRVCVWVQRSAIDPNSDRVRANV
jgi:hypothetical protein